MTKGEYTVAVMGATGLVGRTILSVLEEHKFPIKNLVLLASEKSKGQKIAVGGKQVEVQVPTEDIWKGVDIALFSAGGSMSELWAPIASKHCVVVDNSSAFRMKPDVPLVVPEVNPHAIFGKDGKPARIIANPNCSTIQMVVALKPLHDKYHIKRIVVSTYQSVTGKGKQGLEALEAEVRGEKNKPPYTHFKAIAYNVVPQIDVFLNNGYTKEEMKMVNETKKIMEDNTIEVSPTTVRVPVYGGHSEAINVEFEKEYNIEDVFDLLRNAKGIVIQDDPKTHLYPVPIECYGKDPVYVGRIRRDISNQKALNMWVVADNLRKGAATNAVQIAEEIIK